jgi:hypothetical protein
MPMKRNKPSGRKRSKRESSQKDEFIRGLVAINRARRGSGYITVADARAEGTTLAFIKRHLASAIFPSTSNERLRVRPTDSYSQLVQIVSESGDIRIVTALGSAERQLAGLHRAAYLGVLANRKQGSILRRFRNKTVGGVKLLADAETLFRSARGGIVDDLDALYVSPETSR